MRPVVLQVIDCRLVDREEAHRRAVFGRHVADRRAVGHRQRRRASPKNSTNLPTTFSLRSISVTVSTRSVAVTPSLQLARQLDADDVGREEVDRLPEHPGFGLDAAARPTRRRRCR